MLPHTETDFDTVEVTVAFIDLAGYSVLASASRTGILNRSHGDGYCFSREPADWIAYERAQVHTGLTRFVRLIKGTAYPHAQLEPDDDWIRLVFDQLIGVRAMLEGITRQ